MPELPEVERARRLLEERCLDRQVISVRVSDDPIVFCNTEPTLFKALGGQRVKSVDRRGKLFFIQFEQSPALVCHFGMTGNIQFASEAPFEYRRSGKNVKEKSEWPPRYWKLIMELAPNSKTSNKKPATTTAPIEDKIFWAFTDPRRLGRIRLVDRPLNEPPISELGFDPILSMPSKTTFAEAVSKRRTPIKALLLDQHFSAGVGNWIADEVLYQSRIHPGRPANSLTNKEVDQLHEQVHAICKQACAVNADSKQFPADWLFHRRWGKGREKRNKQQDTDDEASNNGHRGPVTTEGHPITFETHGGRTSAVVLALQQPHSVKQIKLAKASTVVITTKSKRPASPQIKEEIAVMTSKEADTLVSSRPKRIKSKRMVIQD